MTRSLRQLVTAGPTRPARRCELCAAPITDEHRHVVEVAFRRLLCACPACALLFVSDDPSARYRRVPGRYLSDPDFVLTERQWDALRIPVGLAFFLRNSAQRKVIACYPSPAGATESELELAGWTDGVGSSALAGELVDDVEALLVRRVGTSGHPECLLVPIDTCYRLVGLVRLHWKGFDGGSQAWAAIDGLFAELHERARPLDRC